MSTPDVARAAASCCSPSEAEGGLSRLRRASNLRLCRNQRSLRHCAPHQTVSSVRLRSSAPAAQRSGIGDEEPEASFDCFSAGVAGGVAGASAGADSVAPAGSVTGAAGGGCSCPHAANDSASIAAETERASLAMSDRHCRPRASISCSTTFQSGSTHSSVTRAAPRSTRKRRRSPAHGRLVRRVALVPASGVPVTVLCAQS
jgi:hypothetical protein